MIFTSPNESFSTSSTSVLNVVKDLKPTLTKSAAEHFIDTLIHHGWIHKSSQGYLSLSSRALLELQTYLKEQYPDEILTCHECQHIVTRGLSCGSCDVKIHKQCEVFIIGHGNQKQCPECKVNWEPSSIGEENLNRYVTLSPDAIVIIAPDERSHLCLLVARMHHDAANVLVARGMKTKTMTTGKKKKKQLTNT